MELVALLVASVALGVIRPRWSTLAAVAVPTALAFMWLLMHEDIPGEAIGPADLAWYAGMSIVAGAAFALPIAMGVVLGRTLLHPRRRPSDRGDRRAGAPDWPTRAGRRS